MNTYENIGIDYFIPYYVQMTHRIQSGWINWKSVSGVVCDRRISLRVKGTYTRRL